MAPSCALNRVANALALWMLMTVAMLASCASAIPQGCTKERAYSTAMKSDLRNMMSAQEAFRAAHGEYATNAVLQSGAMAEYFRPSTGVRITIEHADHSGWRARTTHSQLSRATCGIGSIDGEPRCVMEEGRRRPRYTRNGVFNLSIDLWLFAFSLYRRQRRAVDATA